VFFFFLRAKPKGQNPNSKKTIVFDFQGARFIISWLLAVRLL